MFLQRVNVIGQIMKKIVEDGGFVTILRDMEVFVAV